MRGVLGACEGHQLKNFKEDWPPLGHTTEPVRPREHRDIEISAIPKHPKADQFEKMTPKPNRLWGLRM